MRHTLRIEHKKEKGVLLLNTVMLYILQFSTYLLNFIVVPYESRVLKPELYGVLGLATAIMVYFQLVIDFGFILSATEEVSRNRNDTNKLRSLLTSVTVGKLVLSVFSAVCLFILCRIIPQWREHTGFFMLFLAATALNSLMPDFIYRGLEKMTAITVRAVAIKAFFAGMIFVFLREPDDLLLIPILNIIGNALALVFIYLHLSRKLHITFGRFDLTEFKSSFKKSLYFFFSRIASSIYTAGNTIILSILTNNGGTVGLYTAAEKVTTTAKSAMTPISDSLYPYMIKNRDFKLIRKILAIFMPIILLGCGVVFVYAEPLCLWFFGAEYAGTGQILRALLPVVVVILPSYILGFPTLSAMGLSRHANYSVIVGSALHIAGLVSLYFTGFVSTITLAGMVSVTETVILLYRLIVVLTHRRLLRQPPETEGV
ncbi:MAG: oligosaccharide flippase family protein [Firmicutes bacterium]|nr:oligosaccharide flippase family protein [Bacillota bacterium]